MPPATKPKKAKASPKTSVKKGSPPPESFPLLRILRGWMFRPTPLVLTALLISIAVMSPYIPYLLPNLAELKEYQFELDQIQVNAANPWVPASLIDDVLKESNLPRRVSLLESGLSRKVALAFEMHPWVRKVEFVRLTSDPAIQAVIDYRQPVAFISLEKGFLPVDQDGVRLPVNSFTAEDVERLPHILNLQSNSNDGQQISHPRVVLAATRIAEILAPDQDMERYWNRFKLKAIIAPQVNEDDGALQSLTFEILTEGGSHIIWGNPPGADQLEPTPEQKLGRMEQYVSRYGDFDSPQGPYRIDIRLFQSTSVEPLNQRSYQ